MADNAKIPFLDLVTPHAELKDDLCDVFQRALGTGGFISGPMVQGFEEDFCALLRNPALHRCGQWHRCVALCSDRRRH